MVSVVGKGVWLEKAVKAKCVPSLLPIQDRRQSSVSVSHKEYNLFFYTMKGHRTLTFTSGDEGWQGESNK